MVNGEDYTNFPFTTYNSILKSSAVNRSSIGTSRYLDLVDPTGTYSSTNIFAADGALWYENTTPAFTFAWQTTNDINNVILNDLTPILLSETLKQFYYANFQRPNLVPINYFWQESTTIVNETTGYFMNSSDVPQPIGQGYASNNAQYIVEGSLVKFVPPTGYYFDSNNELQPGVASVNGGSLTIWASVQAVIADGTNQGLGNLTSGVGPVVLNTYVPTGAIANQVIPLFINQFSTSVKQTIYNQIYLNANFGLGYDSTGSITGTPYTWYVITAANLHVGAAWSQEYAGDTTGTGLDASWLIQCTFNGNQYTTISRSLDYYYGSVLEVRFFFDSAQAIYDSRTGTVISDYVKVLKVNSQPTTNSPLLTDINLKIIGQPVLTDGLVDDFQVLVSYQDYNNDGIPDDPDFFHEITGAYPGNYPTPTTTTSTTPWAFFQLTTDFDNLQRYLLQPSGTVISIYATQAAIELVREQYVTGQVFYAYSENNFYILEATLTTTRVLTLVTGWKAEIGRQSLYFQYRHNSALTNLIDPGSTNIIDLYLVTLQYYTAYLAWIQDTTNTVAEPTAPNINELTTEYAGLQTYKMISDNMILNSVEFVPLFGSKAAEALRATIKVVPAPNTNASNNQIQNLVLSTMNAYFDIGNWNFGDTFYFSELSAYIHSQIGTYVASVVLVPLNPQLSFGALYEIQCAPNQIFVNGANINDIQIITALTSTNLQSAGAI